MNNKINFLSKTFFLSIIVLAFSKSARGVEIDRQNFCSLTVKDYLQEYRILVPRPNVKSILDQLNVIGINCRNETRDRRN